MISALSIIQHKETKNGLAYQTRIIIKKGEEFYPVTLTDVVAFYAENGTVFLLTSDNRRYMVHTDRLNLVYDSMDRSIFYRANRKYIFNVNYLSNYKLIGNDRILIELKITMPEHIIISRYRSNDFRGWIEHIAITGEMHLRKGKQSKIHKITIKNKQVYALP